MSKLRYISDEEIRIKVAELCGWVNNGANYWHKNGEVRALNDECSDGCGGIGDDIKGLPKYDSDLNAMYEAEEFGKNNDEHWTEKWLEELALVLSDDETNDYLNVGKYELIHSTARQRAEAFILAMNK